MQIFFFFFFKSPIPLRYIPFAFVLYLKQQIICFFVFCFIFSPLSSHPPFHKGRKKNFSIKLCSNISKKKKVLRLFNIKPQKPAENRGAGEMNKIIGKAKIFLKNFSSPSLYLYIVYPYIKTVKVIIVKFRVRMIRWLLPSFLPFQLINKCSKCFIRNPWRTNLFGSMGIINLEIVLKVVERFDLHPRLNKFFYFLTNK